MSTPDAPPPIRIGTIEREAAYKALNAHLEAGRLDPDEYGDRYAKASLARTRNELDVLFVDLPQPARGAGLRRSRRRLCASR